MLANIQALRALAAIMVVITHLGGLGMSVPQAATFQFSSGVFGVDLFFVISGVIIAHTSARYWGNPLQFLALRAARIYPLYWAAMIPYAGGQGLTLYFLTSAMLLPVLSPDGGFYPALDVGWTLIYELWFYLMVAAAMALPRRAMLPAVTGFLAVSYCAGGLLPEGAWRVFLSNTIMAEFAFGLVIWRVWQSWKPCGWVAVLLSIPAALVFFLVPASPELRFIAYGLPACYPVFLALWLEHRGFSAPQWAAALGDASYAIYITHPVVLMWLSPGFARALFPLFAPSIISASVLLLCIVTGLAVFRIIDRPVNGFLRNLVFAKKSPPGSSPAGLSR